MSKANATPFAPDLPLILLIGLIILYYGLTQPLTSLDEGHPYDAQVYFDSAVQIAEGQPISGLRPFSYRIALPYLVGSFFPENITFGFRFFNLVFGLLTLPLLHVFLQRYLNSGTTIYTLLLLYVTNPNGLFRFAHFIPAYADPPALFFILLFLVLNQRLRELNWRTSLVVAAVGVIGVLFREIVLCGVLVYLFGQCFEIKAQKPYLRIISKQNLAYCTPPVLACLLTLWLIHASITGTGSYSYTSQMHGVLVQLFTQPSIYFVAWLTTFGCIPIVLVLGCNASMRSFLAKQQSVTIFLFGSILLSLSAGYHTDRIIFWSYPAILLLFGHFMESHPIMVSKRHYQLLFFLPIIIVQALAHRVWLPIPDDPNGQLFAPDLPEWIIFGPYGESSLAHIYASAMLPETRMLILSQFGVFAFYLLIVMQVERLTKATSKK